MGEPWKYWLIIFFFGMVVVIIFNVTLQVWEDKILRICKTEFQNFKEMKGSEINIMNSYFDLKSQFVINDPNIMKDESFKAHNFTKLYQQMRDQFDQNELIFTERITQSLFTFGDYDDTYLEELSNILVDNLCGLLNMTQIEVVAEKCKAETNLLLVKKGFLHVMNYFQRTVKNTIEELGKGDFNR